MKTHSFHLNNFWFHVTMIDDRRGKDQRGGLWIIQNGSLEHESGVWKIAITDTIN